MIDGTTDGGQTQSPPQPVEPEVMLNFEAAPRPSSVIPLRTNPSTNGHASANGSEKRYGRWELEFYRHLLDIDSMDAIVQAKIGEEMLPSSALRPIYRYALRYYQESEETRTINRKALETCETGVGTTLWDLVENREVHIERDPELSIEDLIIKVKDQWAFAKFADWQRAAALATTQAPSGERIQAIDEQVARWANVRAQVGRRLKGDQSEDEKAQAALDAMKVTTLAGVEEAEVTWLWKGYLPVGMVTTLDGPPGQGKSLIGCDLAARVSTGAAMPDGTPGLGTGRDVILMAAEDHLAAVIKPRIRAAGGDCTKIHALEGFQSFTEPEDPEETPEPVVRWPDLSDIAKIKVLIEHHGAALLVIDVLMSYLGEKTNSFRDQDIRRLLGPLAKAAEETGCAVLALRHLKKAVDGNAVNAGGGSIGIIGQARLGLMVGEDPDDDSEDPNNRRRLLAVTKSNLASKAPTLSYAIVGKEVEAVNGSHISTSGIVWGGPTSHAADDLVGPKDSDAKSAKDFLASILADGPMLVDEVSKAGKQMGFTPKQLRTAKEKLKIGSERTGFDGAPWYWCMPGHSPRQIVTTEEAPTHQGDKEDPPLRRDFNHRP